MSKGFLLSFDRKSFNDIREEVRVVNHLISENIAKYHIALEKSKVIRIRGIFLF